MTGRVPEVIERSDQSLYKEEIESVENLGQLTVESRGSIPEEDLVSGTNLGHQIGERRPNSKSLGDQREVICK